MTALGGVLGHRCPVCAHPSHDHRDHGRDVRRCCWPRCACRTTADALVASPTEIYPLYVGGGLHINGAGRRLDRVVPPGDELGDYRSCACDRCRAWYAAHHTTTARSTA